VEKKKIPARIAVLPPKMLPINLQKTSWPVDPESKKGRFIRNLVRQTLFNHLLGKGYTVISLKNTDEKLASLNLFSKEPDPESIKEICKLLNADGVVYTVIDSASMVSALAFDIFSIEAQVKMFNKDGKELGTWTEKSSKKKLSIPLTPLSIATTVTTAVFLEPSAKRQMRMVIYDWGWKISQLIPDNPYGTTLPKLISVNSNIDKGVFGIGDKITVTIEAEKDITCFFDIGTFKKRIPLNNTKADTYQGFYLVKKGDHAFKQPLVIHLIRPNGTERVWIESEGTITIDGIAPPCPEKVKADVSREGVSISWTLSNTEDIKEFSIERSDTPVGGFSVIAKTKDLRFLDTNISHGKTYYYRIVSVDNAGNRSHSKPISVTVPFFEQIKLSGQLKGNLIAGTYLLEQDATVPEGEFLNIGHGVRIKVSPGVGITVKGKLVINGSPDDPVVLTGDGWKGISVETGKLIANNFIIKGCSSCIHSL
jgi:hypothetical protein